MTTVTSTSRVMLNAKPEEVFACVADLTRHPEWSGGPLKVEALTPGPATVGSQYRSTGGQQDRINVLQVTKLEAPSCFSFMAKDERMGEIFHEFTFKAQDGGTLMGRKVTSTMPMAAAILFLAWSYPTQGKS